VSVEMSRTGGLSRDSERIDAVLCFRKGVGHAGNSRDSVSDTILNFLVYL